MRRIRGSSLSVFSLLIWLAVRVCAGTHPDTRIAAVATPITSRENLRAGRLLKVLKLEKPVIPNPLDFLLASFVIASMPTRPAGLAACLPSDIYRGEKLLRAQVEIRSYLLLLPAFGIADMHK
jgi:hypothetical protein